MAILGLHTAGTGCDVAIVSQSGEVLSQQEHPTSRGQDAALPRLVAAATDAAGTTLKRISMIAVVVGPGSFTGIRLTTAFGRGLAVSLKCPCVGVTSLEACLPQGQQGSAMVVLPAKRREPDITFWTQSFRSGEPTAPPEETTRPNLLDRLTAHPHIIYGNAENLLAGHDYLTIHAARPSAATAARRLALNRFETRPPRPVYVRPPDADLPAQKSK
ncbi:MAG: tRNA (adenosine(37)-N6)-threonylcarbamoyltransferase complex dimerization subunit type 1 TsaB [Hyphomonadaceae bacterium]|nr:tRNA (adenosine(37)-N6)-threonylcarbamoyltransferase complex dimerization subunit type 1 TsaB [Hyphomonadaceae bacterium]OUX94591.1 MAG: tRNA (adenosine(37)-N6)-threonylcarbamoyltransferase complex dimerization subunit type 1 TsaB [Hyphomonas sp. TMED17]